MSTSILTVLVVFVLLILFACYGEHEKIFSGTFPLEKFEKIENGYVYSYYDENDVLVEDIIEGELINRDFYNEAPFVDIKITSKERRFWFVREDIEGTDTNYVFHVVPSEREAL